MKPFHIWMEGFAATGQSSDAQCITKEPIMAETFDDAVRQFMRDTPEHGIEENIRDQYNSELHYQGRGSNWNIWACNLFDNEQDARKHFG